MYSIRNFSISILLALLLLLFDVQTELLRPIRFSFGTIVTPFQYTANWIANVAGGAVNYVVSTRALAAEVSRLQDELLSVRQQLQQAKTRAMETERLQQLLRVSEQLNEQHFTAASLLGISGLPHRMTITLDKGSGAGVLVGQFVVDGWGLVGVVVEVMLFNALVLRITDPSHSMMVENARTGKRILLRGSGSSDRLDLQHLPVDADIHIGDQLWTSGLGGVYPAGYLVAVVDAVEREESAFRLRASAVPQARVEQSRRYLVVGSGGRVNSG